MGVLKGKKVVLGVTGGIAAYKSAEIVRILATEGAEVTVAMTRAAREFVAPLTFATLSGNTVITDMFPGGVEPEIKHIRIPESADAILIAPATANFLAKAACGIADDFLTTMLLVARCPIIAAPAMNTNMYSHPVVQENIRKLKERGVTIITPDSGELACGYSGPGRLPNPEDIVEVIRITLSNKDLKGEHVLVTAGPTREAIDPVRFVSNRSSGKMGFALAKAAVRRGAEVTLISGPTALKPPLGTKLISVETAEQMLKETHKKFSHATVLLMAAAVADYKPKNIQPTKIKKTKDKLIVEMNSCPDILQTLATKKKKNQVIVGFAAETDNLLKNAKEKLKTKNLDMIVANQVGTADSGFEHDTNRIKIISKDGELEDCPLMTKEEAADKILDKVVALRQKM